MASKCTKARGDIVPRSGGFLARVRVHGFADRAKTFPKRDAAKAWAKQQRAELVALRTTNRSARADISSLTFRDLISDYLEDRNTKELESYTDIEARLTWWIDHYANTKLLDFNPMLGTEARNKLDKNREPGTVNRYLGTMRSTWNWGIHSGRIPGTHDWPKRLMLKEPNGRTRCLSKEEIDALLRAAEKDAVIRTAILVSLSTGLRQGELLRLDWADIDFEKSKVTVHKSKTERKRLVPITANALAALRRLRTLCVGPSAVFLGKSNTARLDAYALGKRWRPIRKAAGLQDFRWHDLRHSCASFLAQHGATLLQIGSVLGHASPVSTMRYAHLVEGVALPQHDELDKLLK